MISVTGVTRAAVVVVLLAAGAVRADTHAPWPTNWNNWNDSALWVSVGNPGNTGELSGTVASGTARICGAVDYAYNMGKFEVMAGQYTAFLNAVAKTDTHGLYNENMDTAVFAEGCNIKRTGSSGAYNYSVASDYANRPVNFVSFWDSCRFANWLQNGQLTGVQGAGSTEQGTYALSGYNGSDGRTIQRSANTKYAVASEDEWYKAAFHKFDGTTDYYFDYPTSSYTAPGRDMADASGNNANIYGTPFPIDSGKYATVAGEFQNSASPYGTFDQGGNVGEWNEAIPYQDSSDACRGMRGGSFYGGGSDMIAAQRDIYADPRFEGPSVGFRIVEVPEPATLSLLALGGLLALRRRR